MISSPATRALDALRRVVHALFTSAHDLERQAGITPAQRFVLEQLVDGALPTLNALAARTRTRQATVSVVVGRLEARGLVSRQRDSRDRRRVSVALTAAGRRLLRRSAVPVQARLTAALDRMPARDVKALALAFEAWVNAAGLRAVPPRLFLEPGTSATRGRRGQA